MEHAYRFLLEVAVFGGINVHKFLRIPVAERAPRALYLYHQPVAFFERMGDVGDRKLYGLHLIGGERQRFLKAFTETSAHDLAVDQHLVTAHRITGRRFVATGG